MTLHARWHPMRPHSVQRAYYESVHRFNVVPAGRRSGKSETAKRRLVRNAIRGSSFDRPRYFYAAPTYGQVKRIAWDDLKRMVPKDAMRGKPSESELTIPLWHGGEIFLVGMDKPERIEGAPVDGGVLDEYANMKAQAWGENVRPTLSDRNAWCDLIGVPEGRNHYYDRAQEAQAQMLARGAESEWGYFHWKSAEILPAKEIEAAKRDLDELTFEQEYGASFVNFSGRAYYNFSDANKAPVRSLYNPDEPLMICLDFNVAPGVAVIAQEVILPVGLILGTAVIGEVWIENNSNTVAVCRRILADWGQHRGRIEVYGDATGGARGTAKVQGSDWDLARQTLCHGDPSQQISGFGNRVSFHVKSSNPPERSRVNAVNSRILAIDGSIRMMVDPLTAPHVAKDFEGVRTLDGGSGEIDKKYDKKLTHISDALGYYIEHQFPINDQSWSNTSISY